jgi:hypothetical protein
MSALSRRSILRATAATAALVTPAAVAAAAPTDHPNDARLSALIETFIQLRDEVSVIQARYEELSGALGISMPPFIEYTNLMTELRNEEGTLLTSSGGPHRAWNVGQIRKQYSPFIELYGPQWEEKRDRQIERFRRVKAEWYANREREDVARLRNEVDAAWARADAMEYEIRAIRPDTLDGLVTQLRYLAWNQIGCDYADIPIKERDWNEQALLIVLADAERLAGASLSQGEG